MNAEAIKFMRYAVYGVSIFLMIFTIFILVKKK